MSSSSLSNVVSTLVRASMGTSVTSTVTDEELDRHVAELILKEAKQKAQQYLEHGVKAYLPEQGPDERQPRANKRFLTAIIRNTDEHNKAILRAQVETAQEIRAKKEEEERGERKARAKEASETGRLRRLIGSSHRRDNSWDRWDGRRRHSSREGRSEGREREADKHRKRTRQHSRTRSTSKSEEESRRRTKRRRRREEDRESSRSRDPVEGGSNLRRKGDHDAQQSSRKLRRHSRSRSNSLDRGRHGDDSLNTRETTDKKREKGKAVDRVSQISEASCSMHRMDKLATSNKTDFDNGPERSTISGLSHHRTTSPGRTTPRSPLPSSPLSTGLSSQFRARNAALKSPARPASPTLSEEEDIERMRPRRRRSIREQVPKGSTHAEPMTNISPRSLTPELSSKMDKYFESSYDPRLDVGPLTSPNIPSTGLIDGTEFEGWEAMLEVVRQRREDRAERKRLERLGLLPNNKEKSEKKTLKDSGAWTMDTGVSVMDIKYNKRGAVREWDMGK